MRSRERNAGTLGSAEVTLDGELMMRSQKAQAAADAEKETASIMIRSDGRAVLGTDDSLRVAGQGAKRALGMTIDREASRRLNHHLIRALL